MEKEVINNHLRNKDEHGGGIIGIYPLLQDETCLFLAVGFDEEKWKEDITAFRSVSVCTSYNIPIAIERSRSGNGAHAWIFFDEPVSAVSARRFGNTLLTTAMTVRHEIRFTSYDRKLFNDLKYLDFFKKKLKTDVSRYLFIFLFSEKILLFLILTPYESHL